MMGSACWLCLAAIRTGCAEQGAAGCEAERESGLLIVYLSTLLKGRRESVNPH